MDGARGPHVREMEHVKNFDCKPWRKETFV